VYLQQFFVEGLGHQSYLVGSDTTKEAFVRNGKLTTSQRRSICRSVATCRRNWTTCTWTRRVR